MSSYSDGINYGYDEINVNSSNFTDNGDHFESNGIKSIKSRERRLQQKLHMNMPGPGDLRVDHYSESGCDNTKIRRQIIQQPEDYFVMGQNDYNKKAHTLESFKGKLQKQTNRNIKLLTTKNNKLQEDIEDLEYQNKMLTFFIYFLIIIIIVQYSNTYNVTKSINVTLVDPRTKNEQSITVPMDNI
jgi:hypothetical protein